MMCNYTVIIVTFFCQPKKRLYKISETQLLFSSFILFLLSDLTPAIKFHLKIVHSVALGWKSKIYLKSLVIRKSGII